MMNGKKGEGVEPLSVKVNSSKKFSKLDHLK